MQIFHNPRIERKISFPKFSILFSSKDTNNNHIQLQIYTNAQIFYIPSTERIKKKKNFLPISIDSQIVRSKNEEANNRSAFSAEGTRKMSKKGRHTLVPRKKQIDRDRWFSRSRGRGDAESFPPRPINKPSPFAERKRKVHGLGQRSTRNRVTHVLVHRCVSVCGTLGAATLRRYEHDQEINALR